MGLVKSIEEDNKKMCLLQASVERAGKDLNLRMRICSPPHGHFVTRPRKGRAVPCIPEIALNVLVNCSMRAIQHGGHYNLS